MVRYASIRVLLYVLVESTGVCLGESNISFCDVLYNAVYADTSTYSMRAGVRNTLLSPKYMITRRLNCSRFACTLRKLYLRWKLLPKLAECNCPRIVHRNFERCSPRMVLQAGYPLVVLLRVAEGNRWTIVSGVVETADEGELMFEDEVVKVPHHLGVE